MNCPQEAGHRWRITDDDGVCAENPDDMIDWEYPDNDAEESLGFYLDTWSSAGWISPTMPGYDNCGVQSYTSWKDTTSVNAYNSNGSVQIYYEGYSDEWTECAYITDSYSTANYDALMSCPQEAGLKWKLEDETGVCAENPDDWVDWEYPDD